MAKKRPALNFDSRLLLALEEGCKREVRLLCAGAKEAIRLRHEINTLRAALREQNRTDWQRFYQAGLYIDKKDPRVLLIKPKDGEFKSILDAAGVPDLAAPPAAPEAQPPEPVDEKGLEAFLHDLKNLRN